MPIITQKNNICNIINNILHCIFAYFVLILKKTKKKGVRKMNEKQYLLEIERECRLLLMAIPESDPLFGYRMTCLKNTLLQLAKHRDNRQEVNRCKALEKANNHIKTLLGDNING